MAIVKKYKATVVDIENKIEGVYTLTFASKNGKFRYSPGQFLHLAIDTDYDGSGQWPESRCFSMQSSPANEFVKITYAVKGDFTNLMEQELRVGREVWLKLPYGELFDQEHDNAKAVFISGGTGITPYLSLITDASFASYQNPVLYAGFRSRYFNIYSSELEWAAVINSQLIVNQIYQDSDGILDIERIFSENGVAASYFISGPPLMIKIFKQKLLNNGVMEVDILTDDWE